MKTFSPLLALIALAGCSTNGQSLIETSREDAGDNCVNGGVRIEVGFDDNGDGALSVDEVNDVSYACDGSNGLQGASGGQGEDGKRSECVGVPELTINGSEGLPGQFVRGEQVPVTMLTNTSDPALLAVEALSFSDIFEFEDLMSGVLGITPTDLTLDPETILVAVTDGCTTAYTNLALADVTGEPAWIRPVNIDYDSGPYFLKGESSSGFRLRMPETTTLDELEFGPTQEVVAETYALTLESSWSTNLGQLTIPPYADWMLTLWENGYTGNVTAINRMDTSVAPPAGQARVRLVNLNENMAAQDIWAGDGSAVVAPFFIPGAIYEMDVDLDFSVVLTDNGGVPTPGKSLSVGLPEGMLLEDGEFYELFLYDKSLFSFPDTGKAHFVSYTEEHPAEPADPEAPLPELDFEAEFKIMPMPLQATEVDVNNGGTVSTEMLPYPAVDGWVPYADGDDISDPSSVSYREFTVPGAENILIEISFDTATWGDWVQVNDGAGNELVVELTGWDGFATKTLFVAGDTAIVAVHSDGWYAPYSGYRLESIGYSE